MENRSPERLTAVHTEFRRLRAETSQLASEFLVSHVKKGDLHGIEWAKDLPAAMTRALTHRVLRSEFIKALGATQIP